MKSIEELQKENDLFREALEDIRDHARRYSKSYTSRHARRVIARAFRGVRWCKKTGVAPHELVDPSKAVLRG